MPEVGPKGRTEASEAKAGRGSGATEGPNQEENGGDRA